MVAWQVESRRPATFYRMRAPIADGMNCQITRRLGILQQGQENFWRWRLIKHVVHLPRKLTGVRHNAHNLRQWEEADEDMPAAFWVGHHPLVLLGARSPAVDGTAERTERVADVVVGVEDVEHGHTPSGTVSPNNRAAFPAKSFAFCAPVRSSRSASSFTLLGNAQSQWQ